jgi:glycosyltransferase involved in cell wall biosynthesis
MALPFVLVGEAQERDQDYLAQVRQVRGVTCMGKLCHDDKLLASAFAAAAVFALPGQAEVQPMTVLEALAAGTPVVNSSGSEMNLADSGFALTPVAPGDTTGIKRAVMGFIAHPPERAQVRALVGDFTWDRVAQRIAHCYLDVIGDQPRAVAPAGIAQRVTPSINRLYTGP